LAALAAVAVLPLATVGSAQTAAELLQKGIYAQQTAGDVDGAIQVYRQVVGMTGVDRALAARAQMQIVSALLQKGDMASASREFNTLEIRYSDQRELIAATATAMRVTTIKGTFEDGVYHHKATGTRVHLPANWSLLSDEITVGGQDAISVKDDANHRLFVLMSSNPVFAKDIPASLDHDVEQAIGSHGPDGPGFKIRPGTLSPGGIGRVPGPSIQGVMVAFDIGQGAQIEYDAWLQTMQTLVSFRGVCPAASIALMRDDIVKLEMATFIP
jgi:hypothetical protein